ncbi:hypothetical protein RhiJN_01292 [Ceratobasidium sp. AG-Ba]|nr:hypothetical protein RhiJN_01292 [Ceratobasidium sp. AG-Ba]
MEFEEHYKIHLRTMSTNTPHPATVRSLGGVLDFRLSTRSYPDRSFYFQILGRLLGIVFRSRDREFSSHVVIWDWTTGQKIAQVEFPGGPSSSFSFISEDYFVVARNSNSYDSGSPTEGDTMGRLDVCTLHTKSSKPLSYDEYCVASFTLPTLGKGQGESCLHLRCAPTPTLNSCYVQEDHYSRIYDMAPGSQLLCINIRTSSIISFPFSEPYGTLYIPASSLLDMMAERDIHPQDNENITQVCWSDWANHTSWVDTRDFRMNNERYMFGQRTAAFSAEMGIPAPGYNAIVILDFDERRLKLRRVAGSSAAGDVLSPHPTAAGSEFDMTQHLPVVHDPGCGQQFFQGKNIPQRSYVKTIIELPPNHTDMLNSVMMDNEHSENGYLVNI